MNLSNGRLWEEKRSQFPAHPTVDVSLVSQTILNKQEVTKLFTDRKSGYRNKVRCGVFSEIEKEVKNEDKKKRKEKGGKQKEKQNKKERSGWKEREKWWNKEKNTRNENKKGEGMEGMDEGK